MIAEHTWKQGTLAFPRTGTVAQDSAVSVVKRRLGGTLDTFCHLEKCTKCMAACSKQALHSTVRAVRVTCQEEVGYHDQQVSTADEICEFSNGVHCVSRSLLGGGQCRYSSALALTAVCPNFWESCCKNRIYDLE